MFEILLSQMGFSKEELKNMAETLMYIAKDSDERLKRIEDSLEQMKAAQNGPQG